MSWSFDCSPILDDLNGVTLLNQAGKDFVVKKTAEFVMEYILADWPIDTAFSFSEFYVNDGKVLNDADYTIYVHNGLVEKLARQGLKASKSYSQGVLKQFIGRRANIDAGTSINEAEQLIERVNPLPPIAKTGPLQKILSLDAFNPRQKVSVSAQALILYNAGKITEFEKNQFNKGKIKQTIRRLLRKGKHQEAKQIAQAI